MPDSTKATLTSDQWGVVVDRIGQLIHRHGSLCACARAIQVRPDYLSRMFSGAKRNPSDKVLALMGLQRNVSYSRKVGVK